MFKGSLILCSKVRFSTGIAKNLFKDSEMMDYVKIYLININVERLINLSILDFKSDISKSTGNVNENIFIANYNFCEIIIKKNSNQNNVNGLFVNPHITFKGSIHKMWNELNEIKSPNHKENELYKGYNGNQFNINNIFEVRNHLENLFDCNSNQMTFQNIEFGVNTTPLFEPKLYLKGLLYHKNIPFEFRYKGNYAQAEHQVWIFKIYNKSYQYEMNFNVLRIELKIRKMTELKPLGIKTFADINENTLNKAKELLLKRFDEVMHYDYTIIKKNLKKNDLDKLKVYSNPRYWIEDLQPNHRHRPKEHLRKITLSNSNQIHQQIRFDIIKKCVMNNQLDKSNKCVINNYSNIRLNTTQKDPLNTLSKRVVLQNQITTKNILCQVTKINISMQKNDSILLSHTGLKYYYKTDRKVFEQIKRKYLTEQWTNSDFETQIKEIAHNIRNAKSNQKTKQIRIYQPQQINLLPYLGL